MSYRVLCLNLKLLSGQLSHFSHIWRAFGALMFLLKPKGPGGESSMSLFNCFNTLVTLAGSNLFKHSSSLHLKAKREPLVGGKIQGDD
jgi:hypothetical protein